MRNKQYAAYRLGGRIEYAETIPEDAVAILADRDAYPFSVDPHTNRMYDDSTFVEIVAQEAPELDCICHPQFQQYHTNFTRDICMVPLQDFQEGPHGPIYAGWIYFNNWDTKLCYAIWKHSQRLEQRATNTHAARRGAGFASEKAFVDAVAERLFQQGWVCTREVWASPGRIDLLASREGEVRIIEAKLSTDLPSLSQALGQLLLRKQAYPQASLWIATPKRPSEPLLKTFASHGVCYLDLF